MNYSIVLYILGCVLKFESAFLVLPALVGLIYREHASVSYLAVAVLCLILGVLLTHKKPRSTNLYTREGFVAVALSWIIMSIFGAIPFVLTGDIPFYVDALFETISGFTTTGSSILLPKDPAHHPSVSVFESQVGMLYPSTSQQG